MQCHNAGLVKLHLLVITSTTNRNNRKALGLKTGLKTMVYTSRRYHDSRSMQDLFIF